MPVEERALGRHVGGQAVGQPGWYYCSVPGGRRVAWPCPDLRDLLAAFADHLDYRQEWVE